MISDFVIEFRYKNINKLPVGSVETGLRDFRLPEFEEEVASDRALAFARKDLYVKERPAGRAAETCAFLLNK